MMMMLMLHHDDLQTMHYDEKPAHYGMMWRGVLFLPLLLEGLISFEIEKRLETSRVNQ